MFVYRPFRFSLSPPRSIKGLFTGYQISFSGLSTFPWQHRNFVIFCHVFLISLISLGETFLNFAPFY